MLSRLSQSLRGALQRWGVGGRLAGQDRHGNKYYAVEVKEGDKEKAERRFVVYANHPDPTQLPVEWMSWLHFSRASPPTPEESKSIEVYRQEVKRKAKILAEEEERRKFREESLKDDQFYHP